MFSVENSRVKVRTFLPSPSVPDISVYRVDDLDEGAIWQIGYDYVAGSKPVLARGDLRAGIVFDYRLQITPTEEPHPRHANIDGFPTDGLKTRAIALALAEACELRVPSET